MPFRDIFLIISFASRVACKTEKCRVGKCRVETYIFYNKHNLRAAKLKRISTCNVPGDENNHRPECRDTSGTFTPFLTRTFESSLAKVHKITKKVGQNRSAPLGSFNFMGKRLSLLVSVHMAFVEGMLIKQMRLFLGV